MTIFPFFKINKSLFRRIDRKIKTEINKYQSVELKCEIHPAVLQYEAKVLKIVDKFM